MDRRIMDWLTALIPFLDAYPTWVKGAVAVWLVFTSVILVLLLFFRDVPHQRSPSVQSATTTEPKPPAETASTGPATQVPPVTSERQPARGEAGRTDDQPHQLRTGPSATVSDSPNTTIYQAGRDLILASPPQQLGAAAVLQSLTLEARLTCTIRSGIELPPEKVDLLAWFGGDATLRGAPGDVILKLMSPVYFQRTGTDRLVVINRFVLPEDSHLRFRPVALLGSYSELLIPITTVVNTYAQALDRVRLLEVSIRVNGGDPDYQRYSYDVSFEVGKTLTFTIPLRQQP
jgi:hypothetical protein